jgi:N-acetylglucosaminyldiphosphoundecaprenol N-acetyl-beta-D-mannosaminyltransferase
MTQVRPQAPQATMTQDSDDTLLLDRRQPNRMVSFLGLDFAPLNPDELFDRICEIANRQDGFRYVVTPNVDQMVRLHGQPANRILHDDAWANVNDSRILEVLANRSGLKLPACPGSDLTGRILAEAINPSESVVVIGGTGHVVDALKARFNLSNLHWYQPPMGLRTNPEAVEATAQFCIDHPSRFTFICVGSPQQEMVARAIKLTGKGIGVGLCVGASLEFLAGTRARAPLWMQKARLEWLFRLASEPKTLWRRYLVEGPKIFLIWQQWQSKRKAAR